MSQSILERVLRSPQLPSLPAVAMQVIDLIQRDDVRLTDLAATIQQDPALTTRILKTANSSFYNPSEPITTINQAMVMLGLNSVKTLALGFSLMTNLRDAGDERFDHTNYWKRSLYAATACQVLATQKRIHGGELVFLAGLLQDLGMLAMSQALGEPYLQLAAKADNDHNLLASLERAAFDTDHAQIGGALAERWRLPEQLTKPIRFHEQPDAAPREHQPLIQCVTMGNKVADVFIRPGNEAALTRFAEAVPAWMDVPADKAAELLEEIHSRTGEMRRLFDLPVDPDKTGQRPEQVLARANELLTTLTLQTQMDSHRLREQNQQLASEVQTDPLTCIANRRRFDQYVAEQFEKAARGEAELAVLFIDLDHFKQINDAHGHAAGDRVLKQTAQMLQKIIDDGGLVARYGGEEFAIVLPNSALSAAAELAEKLRERLESQPITVDDQCTLKVTASVGVAAYQPGLFRSADQLVRRADKGVYAAKRAGRNRVRVFVPRPPAQNEAA